jgi:hypothetical protein
MGFRWHMALIEGSGEKEWKEREKERETEIEDIRKPSVIDYETRKTVEYERQAN